MIDGSEKRKCQLAFELQSSRVFEKRTVIKSFPTNVATGWVSKEQVLLY